MAEGLDYFDATTRHWGVFGREGQEKIRRATVAVGGIGGIGSVSAMLLAKASIGRLVLCDRDIYGVENVVQQALASYDVVGMKKADAARQECARHTRFTEIEAFTGDLTDHEVAARLIDKADVVVAAVDNPDARNVLGIMCAQKKIPIAVPAVIGWGAIHMVYMPGEYAYDSLYRHIPGMRWKDGFPDMSDARAQAMAKREWKMWAVALSNWRPEALRLFLADEHPCYWNSAPQCYFCGAQGVLDVLKIITGVGQAIVYPSVFCYDMKSHYIFSADDLQEKRQSLLEVWDAGPEAIMEVVASWSGEPAGETEP